ncbi:hypothetical protein K8I61_09995, partial [bacterium]|nr:hypothetical protein [bacterium]
MRRLIPRLARLVPLAMLAAIGLTLFLGRQPVGSPLAVVAKDTGIGVRGGRLHLRDGAHFAVALDPAWARPIEIELSIKPEWVGQVFFELTTDDGAASLFLTAESFDREFRESRTFRIALDDRAFALRDWGGDTIREVPAPGGAPRSVTLRLVSTGIVATRVEVRSAGNTVFQTNFGPALSDTGVVFALFLAVLFVLYGMSRIDAALLSRAPFLDQQAVRDTFASGLAPFVTGLGFFDSASRPAGIAFLLLATLPWRLALASG